MESPLASAVALGLEATMHCDCPSASPNMLEAIGTAVTRTTLSGQVLGPQERVSPYTALLGVTRNAARYYREDDVKGTITAGKVADLVLLEDNQAGQGHLPALGTAPAHPHPLGDHEIANLLALLAGTDDVLKVHRVVADPLEANRVAGGQEIRHPCAPCEPDPFEFAGGPCRGRVCGG